jgi:hypothetical protein
MQRTPNIKDKRIALTSTVTISTIMRKTCSPESLGIQTQGSRTKQYKELPQVLD